ncbi:unnamed protein product, partial [Meganyctiphanes norvegica]
MFGSDLKRRKPFYQIIHVHYKEKVTMFITVCSDYSIGTIKRIIQKEIGIPWECQKLFNGREHLANNAWYLEDYDINNNSTISIEECNDCEAGAFLAAHLNIINNEIEGRNEVKITV